MSLAKETTQLFEITPVYSVRNVYDKVLYPNGYAYFAYMTLRQAFAAFNTCKYMKLVYENEYYSVNPETIEKTFKEAAAGTTPTATKVQAGSHNISSFIVPIQDDKVLLGNWTTKRLANVKIQDGNVSGVMYKVEGFTEFSSDVVEQSGYYLPFGWVVNTEFTNPKMRVINGRHTSNVIAMDPENIVWVGRNETTGSGRIIDVTATDSDGKPAKQFLIVSQVRFDPAPAPVYGVAEEETPTDPDPETPTAPEGE